EARRGRQDRRGLRRIGESQAIALRAGGVADVVVVDPGERPPREAKVGSSDETPNPPMQEPRTDQSTELTRSLEQDSFEGAARRRHLGASVRERGRRLVERRCTKFQRIREGVTNANGGRPG